MLEVKLVLFFRKLPIHLFCNKKLILRGPVKQPGTTRGAKTLLRRAQIFMSNSFQLCPTNFSRGGEKILGGFSPLHPVVTDLILSDCEASTASTAVVLGVYRRFRKFLL